MSLRRVFAAAAVGALAIAGGFAVGAAAQIAAPDPVQAQGRGFGDGDGFGGGRGRGGGGFGGGGFGRGGGPPVALDPAQLEALKTLYAKPASVPFPADNPPTAAKIALGQRLFFDPGLSGDGKLACASCHDARRGFEDGERLSLGVKGERLPRHTPTVINLAWTPSLFWDGRAGSLEQQAVMPIADENEMGMPHHLMVTRLGADTEYRRLFQRAFPGEPIGPATVGKALAAFERTLVFADSPFDRWLAGDETAISDQAKRGFVDFNTGAGCAQCHSGWNFSDGKFHDIGLPTADVGRFGVDADEAKRHAFKTPGLRNIAERAPYMHGGQLGSLQEVLRFYDRRSVFRPSLAPEMRNVRVRGGRDIAAFLQSLSTPVPAALIRAQEALDRRTGRPAPGAIVASATP